MFAMLLTMVIVIYTRFSSDLQSAKSCEDQEREVREALTRMGIDHSKAIVIHDEAESATKTFRDEFARLEAMMQAGQIGILAVDDQSRLSRADNAFAFITDLVYSGGRFLSTGEGIDTEQTGWELRVKVMELHNSTTIRELGRRVRRGQLGRILGQLSAGDFCYGYESFLVDPAKATEQRGPKPERGLRINEDEAKWVRKIFEWFNEGRSITWMANELTRLGAGVGNRRRSKRWRASHVRKILANEKFIGQWKWGTTRTIRNSQGKKKQIPVPEDQQVVVDRPELRIIDDVTWEKTQARLNRLKEIYGKKPGQKHRAPKVHHTALYPNGLLNGLVFCRTCGARLWQTGMEKHRYLHCPNRGTDEGCCHMTTQVPIAKAEEKLLKFLADLLTSWPEWIDKALDAMRQQITETTRQIPENLAGDERRLKELETQIANLVDALADGTVQSQAVRHRLDEAEQEAAFLRKRIDDARKLLAEPVELPSNEWILQQMNDLASVIREGGYQSALLLRSILGRVEADQMIPPGKKRGYARLHFRINGWEVLKAALQETGDLPRILEAMPSDSGKEAPSDAFVLDLGEPTLMDRWAPKIAELRAAGIKWTEIVEITGLDLNRAYRAWKRHVDAQHDMDEDKDEATPEEPDSDDDESDDSSKTEEAA